MLFFPGKKKFWGATGIAPYYKAGAGGGGGTGTAPALDGSDPGYGGSQASNSVANAHWMTTSQSNDIIVAVVAIGNASAAPTVTGISSASLGAFTKRGAWTARSPTRGNQFFNVELWWALASASTSGEAITASLSGTADAAHLTTFAVHGCNTLSPWDPNGALTAHATGNEGATPSVGGVSITNNGTFLFQVGVTLSDTTGVGAYISVGSPWSTVTTGDQSVGTATRVAETIQYRTFTTAQSGLTCSFSAGSPIGDWITIADTLTS